MSESPRLRLAVVGIVVVSLFSALFARLWYLQVLDSRSFVAAATTNQIRLVYADAPRGRILDRNGQVLVDNRRTQAITVNRSELDKLGNADEVKGRLAALLNLSRDDLDKRIADVRYSQYKPVPVAEGDAVPEELYIYVKEHQQDFPSIEATIVSERTYPSDPPSTAAHVLGYVGEINDRELADRKKDGYRLGDSLGKSGVELVYEDQLRGEPGVTKLQVNSAGEVVKGEPLAVVAPKPGKDVVLTLNLEVQRLAEDSLVQGLEAARQAVDRNGDGRHFEAPAGSVVVLDPRDGSVLAMASYPWYNPAEFVNGIKRDVFAAFNEPASHFPLNNRALQGQYAPGSTFKLVTAVAALETGMIPPNRSIADGGVYKVPNCKGEKCTFSNSGKRAWGNVNLRRALTVSSDVYFYGLGADFWLRRSSLTGSLQQTARTAFGLDEPSGIPLPSDKGGVIPDPDWKKRFCEQIKCVDAGWRTGDSINMAIGQGEVLLTPLQLANAYATFANGGTLYEPRLGLGEAPRAVHHLDIGPAMRQPILDGLKGVVASSEGTAYYAFAGFPNAIFPIAGKTGTAQVAKKHDTALFASFGPADNPQYAISVVMEEAGFGGTTAAPVARRIYQGIVNQGQAPAEPIQLGTGND
ncbi:MAG TPA: penicillin-binding protein 2 [Acidimicrobiales bacterium]|nr:penicillin-binding protein 2 [Acidimicrobiales bacterium]